ncbi:MAG: barstar family protein [Psychrobacter sp.]|uniref:barstar family protein n=1 Tax=Psychrobacter sp. TaxID=56811 RepID=UPI00264A4D4B|nr:barstar family protein [Psychrobacter sp.]MDN5620138.1 barstar family protein [Psychrobacter sp.]
MKQANMKQEAMNQKDTSQAIHYVSQDSINQNGTALSAVIPTQAVTIPACDTLDKTTLLTSLARACHFPSYFSHNWDSAWDCLTDSDVRHLVLDLTVIKKINTEDFNIFKSIIEDAYSDFGKPQLWIIVPFENDT